jgi:peroxiredoxin
MQPPDLLRAPLELESVHFPTTTTLMVETVDQTHVVVVDDRFVTTSWDGPPKGMIDGCIPPSPAEFLQLVA